MEDMFIDDPEVICQLLEENMSRLYSYDIVVIWKEGEVNTLEGKHELTTDMDHEKVDRMICEALSHIGNILEIADE